MLVMSNLYTLRNGSLVMSPQRMFPTTPLIKLGDNHFSKVIIFIITVHFSFQLNNSFDIVCPG